MLDSRKLHTKTQTAFLINDKFEATTSCVLLSLAQRQELGGAWLRWESPNITAATFSPLIHSHHLFLLFFFFLALQQWKTGSCSSAWCRRSATRTTSGSCSRRSDRSRSAGSSEGQTDSAEVCVTTTNFAPHWMLLLWILLTKQPPGAAAVHCVHLSGDCGTRTGWLKLLKPNCHHLLQFLPCSVLLDNEQLVSSFSWAVSAGTINWGDS